MADLHRSERPVGHLQYSRSFLLLSSLTVLYSTHLMPPSRLSACCLAHSSGKVGLLGAMNHPTYSSVVYNTVSTCTVVSADSVTGKWVSKQHTRRSKTVHKTLPTVYVRVRQDAAVQYMEPAGICTMQLKEHKNSRFQST
ncbi:hypothetical protein F4803DRAFT_438606 [Xylaria telfairii]|nr:hypothetical protein F4803DRAFT_438606 [Xylaria telfairii]